MIGVRQVVPIGQNTAALAELYRDVHGFRVVPTDTGRTRRRPRSRRLGTEALETT